MKPTILLLLLALLLFPALRANAQAPVQIGSRTFIDLDGAWQTRPNLGLQCSYPPSNDAWRPVAIPEQSSSLIHPTKISWSYGRSVADLKTDGLTNFDAATDLSAW